MKLRFVFLVVVAASGSGGAFGYFIRPSAFSSKPPEQTFVPYATDGIEGRYRIIADAISSLCRLDYEPAHRGVNEVFTDFTRGVENNWALETQKLRNNKEVARIGPRLRITTKAKDVEFFDVGYLCHDVGVQIHRYKGKLAKSGWHVIEGVPYEGHYDTVLVSPETGEQIITYERLLESPAGNRLAAYAMEEGEGASGLQIFKVEGDKLVSELNSGAHLRNWQPSELGGSILEVIGWIDEETLLVHFTDNRQETLAFRDGKWQPQKSL